MTGADTTSRPATPVPVGRLAGVWHLVSYFDLDDEGRRSPGPLGAAPAGVLVYTADGHMSVSMMRTDRRPAGPPSGVAGRDETFMGYAGSWRLVGDEIRHTVLVSAHPHLVGTELVREAALEGDLLVLHGTSLISGRAQRRVLTWRRAAPPHPPAPPVRATTTGATGTSEGSRST